MKFFKLAKNDIDHVLNEVRKKSDLDIELDKKVVEIVDDVRKRGDNALIEYTRQFDGISLRQNLLRITQEEIQQAYRKVNEKEVRALYTLKKNIQKLEKKTKDRLNITLKANGFIIRQTTRPIRSVGCYIPGGKASYPSTLLMTVVPAKVAGVERTVVATPPNKLTPLMLVASDIAGASEVYRIGGAQAIAALAYGTETIAPVDKIVGPGNAYVTKAKTIVTRDVQVDMPAGPTEIIIYADSGADAKSIALDLISQAEHGTDSVCGLITCSQELAEKVVSEVSKIIGTVDRKEIVTAALEGKGFVIVADGVDTVVDFVNGFAPEHFEVISKDFNRIVDKIGNAGVIIVNSSSVVTDYFVGVNHVLPTDCYALNRGGLNVLDYIKLVRVVIASKSGIVKSLPTIKTLASSEGLTNHLKSIEYLVGRK
ncbi:MAG: histidinol dehydrogenase [Nitrososphaeria archaeon]